MRHFIPIGNVDALPLRLQLERNPQLWNADHERTEREQSPHTGLSDIWVRYRQKTELTSPESFNEKFFPCVWYPAFYLLPDIRPIISLLMQRVQATVLGGVLITKIPSGQSVLPHNDQCSWHARYHNTKVYVPIKANPQCVNITEDERLVMNVGECWIFDNMKMHSVINEGDDDRISLIVSMRCE